MGALYLLQRVWVSVEITRQPQLTRPVPAFLSKPIIYLRKNLQKTARAFKEFLMEPELVV
jgi:hypothetical protein